MATNLQVGETVYLPRERLGLEHVSSAFYRTTVQARVNRSIVINLPNGNPKTIAASLAHRTIGVLLVNIGDYATEGTLLDPLAKSVLQYLRLLLSDDEVKYERLRTLEELRLMWQRNRGAYSHVVVVGHGSQNGIVFGVEGAVNAARLADLFAESGPINLVSLACETGYASFAGALSGYDAFNCVIAPFHTVHGAIASQFCQTLFAYHLLQGESITVAFKHARSSVPNSTSFRMWKKGDLKAGPATT